MHGKFKKALLLALGLVFISGCGSSYESGAAESDAADSSAAVTGKADAAGTLTVRVLKAGKADAIIMTCGGEVLVLDTGETDDGDELARKLRESGAGKVDYLIITHFDKDHVGGAVRLLESFPVGTVYLPDYAGTSAEYTAFMAALSEKGITPVRLSEVLTFTFGDAGVTVEPPSSYEIRNVTEEYDNDFSLITTVVHGENTLLFMGDAEKARITEWLESGRVSDCTLLKVPHHGVYNKALPALIGAVSPEYSVVCDSSKNPADERTMALLSSAGQLFETKDGDVTVVSDGASLTVSG